MRKCKGCGKRFVPNHAYHVPAQLFCDILCNKAYFMRIAKHKDMKTLRVIKRAPIGIALAYVLLLRISKGTL